MVCSGETGVGVVTSGTFSPTLEVVIAMAKAYEETKGSLADRLMAALVAADCVGGDHRGRLAAGVRVAKKGVKGYWLELHVDQTFTPAQQGGDPNDTRELGARVFHTFLEAR